MNSLYKHRTFWLALACMTAQQIFVGLSTVAIGLAGKHIGAGSSHVLTLIFWFFVMIAAAYIAGALGQWLATRLGFAAWSDYAVSIFHQIKGDLEISQESNRRTTQAWITGEALTAFDSTSALLTNFLSLVLNIIFTLAAFGYLLGAPITAAVTLAFVMSFAIMYFSKKPIEKLAIRIQNEKILAFLSTDRVWHNLFFGTTAHKNAALADAEVKAQMFCASNSRYKAIEQVIACAPILATFPLVYFIVQNQITIAAVSAGAVIAVLPRTLQLFQSLHLLNVYIGQLIMSQSRFQKLNGFTKTLDRRKLADQVSYDKISVATSTGENILPQKFIEGLSQNQRAGRFTFRGTNGAGKSSLLRIIKGSYPDAVLLGPEIELGLLDAQGSTGQKQTKAIVEALASAAPIVLLDEWDANLDQKNMLLIDDAIHNLSKEKIVIEVRHKITNQLAASYS
jgi:ABC-type multidrug transport system fused ATPase/permease subunit